MPHPGPTRSGGGRTALLKPDGVFIFEDPYLGDMIAKTSYDQIYDEHVFIFSATSIARAFAPHGLELVDVAPQITHGGSMRYTLAPKGSRPANARVAGQLAKERTQGLDQAETYLEFKQNCENSRASLMRTLNGSGAGQARGRLWRDVEEHDGDQLLRNHAATCRIHLRYNADQARQAVAGRAYSRAALHRIHARSIPTTRCSLPGITPAEIREKESPFIAAGGRWIVYVPDVKVIS